MRLTCPACGAQGSIEFFLRDAAERRSLVAALKLPPALAERVVAYLSLFRPGKRGLTWDRVERILTELMEPITTAQVQRNGRTWAAPLSHWERAFDELLAKRESLRLPLKTHGYLFEVVAGIANQAEAQGEQRQEQRKRYATPTGAGGHPSFRSASEVLGDKAPQRSGGGWADNLVDQEMQRQRAAQGGERE